MHRWHEQKGGRPGLAFRVVHLGNPHHPEYMLCGRDAYAGSLARIDRGPVTCPVCVGVVLACKAVPKSRLRYDVVEKVKAKVAA